MKNKVVNFLLVVVGLVLLLLVRQAQAIFVAEKTIKNNVLRTGEINFSVSPEESVISADNLMPGDFVENSFSVTNTGTGPLTATISGKKSAGYTNFFSTIELEIKSGEQQIYSGVLSELQEIPLIIEPLDAQQQRDFYIRATLPENISSSLDNTYANVTFTITAQQAG